MIIRKFRLVTLTIACLVVSVWSDDYRQRSSDNVFREGDAVKIIVYPDTNFLNGVYSIDGKGKIVLPVVGEIVVTDKTEKQLGEFLEASFVEYLRYPSVQVRPMIRVSLLGGFREPGLYYLDPRASMFEAVQAAGGTEREDGIKKMRWERNRKVVSRNIVPVYESGKSLQEVGFRSGDQLWVTGRPRRYFWEVVTRDVIPLLGVTVSTLATLVTLATVTGNF